MIRPDALLHDLRYGLRMLFRHAGFTAMSVLALGIGIGVNTATFTLYKSFVRRQVQARDPASIANIGLTLESGAGAFLFSDPDYEAYRDQAHSASIIASSNESLRLTGAGGVVTGRSAVAGSLFGRLGLSPPGADNAEFARTFVVSENYFQVLGVGAERGRIFSSESVHDLAASPSVLISDNYWRKRFSADPAVIGRVIRLNSQPFTIIGITPRDFAGDSVAVPDFWLPLSLESLVHPDSNPLHDRENLHLRLFGRLAPGVSMSRAQAEITLVASRLRTLHDRSSEWSRPATATVSPGSPLPGKLPPGLRFTVLLIMVAAGMVLVIACGNVAGIQLARATARRGELSIRLSLGASRARLIRQLLTESALLSVLAGMIALPFTWAILKAGTAAFGAGLPSYVGAFVLDVAPDIEVFCYVFAISILAGLLFGITPALEISRSTLSSSIKATAANVTIRGRRSRELLIASQAAVSLVLMIAGGMLVRSSLRALSMDTGYDGKQIVHLDYRFPEGPRYDANRRLALIRELRSRLDAIPGVIEVTSGRAPDDGAVRAASASGGEALYYTWVQPNYFRTLGIPLLAGAGFNETHPDQSAAILSESAARKLWPARNPIGRSFRLNTAGEFHDKGETVPDGATWRVIGVVRDVRGVENDGSDSAHVWLPLPADRLADYPLLLRASSDPAAVVRAIDSIAPSVDPDLIVSTTTLDAMLRQTPVFLGSVLAAAVAITIGLAGLLLAAMGIYGTVSYMAALRTRELGIRIALGAGKRHISVLMMLESARPVIGGLLAGMCLAAGCSRLLRGVLFGLHALDAASFLGASLLFLAIALLATWPPARRAMRIDPMAALREE